MLPTKLSILSIEYDVVYQKGPKIEEDSLRYGSIDFESRVITIFTKNRRMSETVCTLIHEIVHAVVDAMAIIDIQDSEREEQIVSALAAGLSDVFLRNKLLKIT
jgi:hypothetical protein